MNYLRHVKDITVIIVTFYVKIWYQSSFAISSARKKYISGICAHSSSLCDKGLENSRREGLAKALHAQPRNKIESGKPTFTDVESGPEIKMPQLATFVSQESWIIFNILNLNDTQDWLLVSADLWENYDEYKELKEFAMNLTVKNDIAEKGIAMITQFINKSEEQRSALL